MNFKERQKLVLEAFNKVKEKVPQLDVKDALMLARKLNLRWDSKYVLLFLLTILSSSGVVLGYNVQKLVDWMFGQKLFNGKSQTSLRKSKSSLKLVNGSRGLLVPYKKQGRVVKVIISPPNYDKYEADRLVFKDFVTSGAEHQPQDDKTSNILDSKFLKKLLIIWRRILIPKVLDKNSSILVTQLFFLVLRTYLSLLVTKLDATIVRDLIGVKGRKFGRDLIYWFLLAVPASYTNSTIKYLTKRLALNFRTNLVRYCHDLYMDSRLAYYKLQFNDNSKNLANEYKLDYQYADQYMTEDIAKFSQTLTSLFTSVGKPFMDLIFFSFYLRDNLGTAGIMGIFANYFITGLFLRMKSPKFSKMLKTRSSLEGIFYNYNLSLINNCEEISFYQGIKLEKEKLTSIFKRLTRQITKEIHARLFYGFWEDYILKYTWSALGYLYAAIPIFFSTAVRDGGEFTNMKQFIINKRLMLSLADAGSRLMYSIKDISRLSGYTDRVFDLLLNLHQVHDLNFQYGFTPETIGGSWSASVAKLNHLSNDEGKVCTALTHGVNGTVQLNYPGIRFERIPIVIPSSLGSRGTHLVDNVNIRIKRYDSLLILGNNGSGKSSILRVLSQIWPLYDGLLSRPRDNEIMFVSQRSYFLNNGTLRDQITYPLSFVEVSEMGFSDDHLVMCLKEAGLGYLFDRFGRDLNFSPTGESLKATEETNSNGTSTQGVGNAWFNLLSGGERQKMIIARVLFHNKPYVVLDEPTNAVSFDMEDVLFEVLLKRNFTLVTISHRPILMKYHDYCLEIREDGKYEVQELGNRRPLSRKLLADGTVSRQDSDSYAIVVEKEIKELEKDLARMEDLEVKRTELKRYLDGEE